MTKEFIQSYFNADFRGIDSLISDILVPIFGDYEEGWTEITDNLPSREKAALANIKRIKHAASLWAGGRTIRVFDVTLFDNCHIHTSRKNIQTLIRQYVGNFQGTLIAFHYEDPTHRSWRLSYMEKQDSNAHSTSAKRYTYLCGTDYPCRTIAERFFILAGQEKTDMNLEAAFSVEALSDEFFNGYRDIYKQFCDYLTLHRNDAALFGPEFATCEDKFIRDYVKKMMGRITFLHFLQRKGWLGQPRNIDGWGRGNLNFMHDLFDKASPEQQANFLDEVLEPIFFDCLNEQRDGDFFDTRIPGIRLVKIPYLNGGLFERDEIDKPRSTFPAGMFKHLFDFFGQYNFTIDESDPLDAEVGVDPEMLGKIFENLLEDNKDKGAFYTPKEIVNYMCREALIAYLVDEARRKSEVNKQRQENFEEAIRRFVADPELTITRMQRYDSKQLIDLDASLRSVKICDPAIGSGAFPMGLLNLLMTCRVALNDALGKGEPRAWLKKEIIQNNIYGVDIEKGAIDIARLRFWLSIVVDLDEPEPLPNFDYKFMQGNSLLEQFAGIDLSNMFATTATTGKGSGVELIAFDEVSASQTVLLEQLRHYFEMRAGEDKHQLRSNVNAAVADLIRAKVNDAPAIVEQLNDINISANDRFFLWHTWFADVFNRPGKSGFDIVIGNPPYLFLSGKGSPVQRLLKQGKKEEAEKLQLIFDTYKKNYPEASSGCCDFYKWFFALSTRLAKENGVISLITPDTYFNMPKYKDIRILLFQNSVKMLIDLGFHVFDAPCVSSSIIVYQKDHVASVTVPFVDVKNILKKDNRSHLNSFINDGIQQISINENNLSAYKHPIAEKIYLDEDGLYDVVGNHVKFIEGEHDIQKENLVTSPRQGYVPILLDGEMNKFSYVEIAYTPSSLEISEIHKGERCILRKTGDSIVVSVPYDFSEAIAHQNVYVVRSLDSTSIIFWFGLLNSKMLTFLYQNGLYGQKGRTMAQFRKYALDILPIPTNYKRVEKPIIDLVDAILAAKRQDPQADTTALEAQIDSLVYQLYNLTDEEIQLIEQ